MKRLSLVALCLLIIISLSMQISVSAGGSSSFDVYGETAECYPGSDVTVDVCIRNNPGIMYLELSPVYPSELGTPSIKNGNIFTQFESGKQFLWLSENDVSTDGKLVSLTFSIDENNEPGDYVLNFVFRAAYKSNESSVMCSVYPITIHVKEKYIPVTGVSLNMSKVTIKKGSTVTLTPDIKPEDASDQSISWFSTDKDIATVRDGIVTGIKEGSSTITVITKDGEYSATCVVTVEGDDKPSDFGIRGDIDGNGKVESKDYIMLKRYVLNTFSLDEKALLRADVDNNGKVVSKDYIILKRAVLGTFTIEDKYVEY